MKYTEEEMTALAAELLNTELYLDVPEGWCHKCGRANKESDSE